MSTVRIAAPQITIRRDRTIPLTIAAPPHTKIAEIPVQFTYLYMKEKFWGKHRICLPIDTIADVRPEAIAALIKVLNAPLHARESSDCISNEIFAMDMSPEDHAFSSKYEREYHAQLTEDELAQFEQIAQYLGLTWEKINPIA